ncbi:MAG: hypothetical protein WC800_00155 [Candidatus Nanopelagicaceae bacterium]|jgi:hypothetical protein
MSEIKPGFARDWIEFTDPKDELEIYKCDLTWLTSYWTCIYGDGCKGVFADRPNDGCCTEGAMYSDEDDEVRVQNAAKSLTHDMWQFYDRAHTNLSGDSLQISETDEENERKTRTVDGSCIFLNRKGFEAEGFTGNFGCVLHHLAQKEGKHFVDTKPDVCWQLPLRRSFETREVGEREYSITVIGEYERLAWGDGGNDFDWYCTSNTEAHVGLEPVYISNRSELIALLGQDVYDILVKYCDERVAAVKELAKRQLPLFVLSHPASIASGRI